MQIVLSGTSITQDTRNIGFKMDNLYETITVTVDTPSSYSYKLDIQYPKEQCTGEQLYNIIDLSRSGNVCTVDLTKDMLPVNGKYVCQLRGINTDGLGIIYHSDTFECWVKYSIEPSEAYDPVPSEFYQIEDRISEYNDNPPYPSSTGYWMIWNVDTHQYEQSTIPAGAVLPEITALTAGKFLTNNGTSAQWVTLETTTDFDELIHRPKYNGTTMSSSTDIPEITESTVSGWGFTKNTGTVSSLADLSITATAQELNVLDGITATTAELNYVDGVTSNIQTQMNDKESSSNKVSSISSASTNMQYPSASAVYNALDNIATVTNENLTIGV